jgi:phosphatidylinositol glycan class M
MLAQTFAFVTFNKVCTSQVSNVFLVPARFVEPVLPINSKQYFLWYMVFLPFYLPSSSLLKSSRRGLIALALWIFGQALWLQQGYELEMLGRSTFVPGLWVASAIFFLTNCWILGIVVSDIRAVGEIVSTRTGRPSSVK